MGYSWWDGETVPFSSIEGKTFTKVEMNDSKDEVKFLLDDGTYYLMFHSQDCCESVTVEEIHGDLDDLVGQPITLAEKSTSDEEEGKYGDVSMWTFYKLATINGYVTIRWLGSSNGYYGIGVDFQHFDPVAIEAKRNERGY